MPRAYLLIFGFAALATLLPVAALIAARFVRPTRPSRVKLDPYECGIVPVSAARQRFSVSFYLVAMLFVIFDVETVLLFPWAVRYKQLGWYGLGEAAIFLAFVVAGYIYILRNRVLAWK